MLHILCEGKTNAAVRCQVAAVLTQQEAVTVIDVLAQSKPDVSITVVMCLCFIGYVCLLS